METYKLQKLIANSGFCSRRQAEILIKQGRVRCDNEVAKIGTRTNLKSKIEIDNKILELKPPKKIYLILNKPPGFISTMRDTHSRKTAADLIKNKINSRVFIVGRLDLNSQGLMLFTNDGDLANKIMHPKNLIKKTYEVQTNKPLNSHELALLETGVTLDGKKTAPTKIKQIKNSSPFTFLIELHEGRKRQIRRMVDSFDAVVTSLTRLQIGPIKLENLKLGCSRFLTSNEIKMLLNLN